MNLNLYLVQQPMGIMVYFVCCFHSSILGCHLPKNKIIHKPSGYKPARNMTVWHWTAVICYEFPSTSSKSRIAASELKKDFSRSTSVTCRFQVRYLSYAEWPYLLQLLDRTLTACHSWTHPQMWHVGKETIMLRPPKHFLTCVVCIYKYTWDYCLSTTCLIHIGLPLRLMFHTLSSKYVLPPLTTLWLEQPRRAQKRHF